MIRRLVVVACLSPLFSQHEDGMAKAFLCGYDKKAFLAGPIAAK